jgi:hypothetical protein
MKTNTQLRLFVLLLAFAIAFPALAFQYPLSPEAIREAYFLGSRNDEQSAEVFEKYVHPLPKPENGPHIAWIGIETPYIFVASEMAKSAKRSCAGSGTAVPCKASNLSGAG